MLGDATLAYAEEFTAAPLGIDALYRAESADGDRLVALTMSTSHRPDPFAGHNDARARFTQLRARSVARGGGRGQVCRHRGVGSHTLAATVQTLTLAELRTIVEEVHYLGVRTMCHACGGPGLQAAVDAGIESSEHGAYRGRTPAPIAQMVEQGTYFVPTFRVLALHRERGAPWAQRKARASHEDHLHAFRLARGPGCASRWGADEGVYGHGHSAVGLRHPVEAGMTPLEAITASTRTAAACLVLEGTLGTLEAGKPADLLVVDGDPLADTGLQDRRERRSLC